MARGWIGSGRAGRRVSLPALCAARRRTDEPVASRSARHVVDADARRNIAPSPSRSTGSPTSSIAAPAPGSAALEQSERCGRSARAPAHRRGARSRRDRARQHRVPGAAAARSRRLQREELGRVGGRRRGGSGARRARVHRQGARARPHGVLHQQSRLHGAAAHRHRSVPGQDRHHAQPGGARHRSRARSATPAAARRTPGMEQQQQDHCAAHSSPPTTASWRWWATISATSSIRRSLPAIASASSRVSARTGSCCRIPSTAPGPSPSTRVEEKYAALHTADVVLELPGGGRWKGDETRVRIASWNVEYLMTPATHLALRSNCAENGGMVGGDDRTLPCAITQHAPRTAGRLRQRCATTPRSCAPTSWRCRKSMGRTPPRRCFRATTSASARARTRRRTASRSAAGLPHRCEPEYEPLSLDNAVRRGVVVTFFPGTANEFRLMSVHLKSGCPAGPLTARGRNCELLLAPGGAARSLDRRRGAMPAIASACWAISIAGSPSRRARRATPQGRQLNVYAEIDDGVPAASKLTNITGAAEIHALHHGQRIPRVHRQHPAGPRSREKRAEEILRARGLQ